MAKKDIKINYYEIISETSKEEEASNFDLFKVLEFAKEQETDVLKNDFSNNKFGKFEHISLDTKRKIHFGYIKTGIDGYTNNLIDRITFTERHNPKNIGEGEKQRTHFLIKYLDQDNPVLLIEKKQNNGVAIGQFIQYLRKITIKYYAYIEVSPNFTIEYTEILKENFVDEIMKLSRVVESKIYIRKSVLGSGFLNLTNRTTDVKEKIILQMNAEHKKDIKNTILEIFDNISSNKYDISKVWVKGRDKDNFETRFMTDRMAKFIGVKLEMDSTTGQVSSNELLNKMKDYADSY